MKKFNSLSFGKKVNNPFICCVQVIFLSLFSLSVSNGFSQAASATWALTSNGNAVTTGNITATAVSTGPGRPDYGGIGAMSHTGDGVRSQNWNRASYTGFSITSQYFNRDYYQYTVTPTAGNTFNVSSVTLEASASASSSSWFVYYSLDGFTTYTQLGATRNLTSFTGLNIDVPAGTTLTLRVYGMDLVSSNTYFRNRNVVISGTTSSGCSTPNQPASISGTATLCAGGNQTYSVANDPNATSYTWTLPSGWSGTSTTNTINATAGTNGGTIAVTANNACGSSTQQTLTVSTSAVPNQPAAISGTATICENGTGTYSVTNNPNATSYTWTLPSGWSGTSTTNTINATAGTNGGTIAVTANNACGSSAQQTLTVSTSAVPNQPAAISGTATICENGTGTYSVTNNPNATNYTWTLPSGWSGTSTTNTINATAGTNGGTISVTANNACGSSTQQTFNVTVNTVDNTVSADGIVLTSNQSGASYQWLDCSNGNAPITNATGQSFTPSQNGSYAVEVTLNGCSETSSCIAVNSVGIEDVIYGDLLNVYPNPGEGLYTISSETAFNAASVTVYSASGQLVMSRENIFGNEVKIDLTNQPGGVYVVSLNNREQQAHVRIVKL